MNKIIPLLTLMFFLFFSNCTDSTKQNAESQKAADAKEAIVLDSISNVLEQERIDIESDVQKLEENLKAIEE